MEPQRRKTRSARLLARCLGLPRAEARPFDAGSVRRILVIRIDERLGNVLLTTPLLRALERHFPGAELDVLVSESKRSLLEGWVRAIPWRKKDLFRHPIRFWGLLRTLRARRYDLAFDASHWDVFSLSSALLLGWSRASWRVAHERGEAGLFATHLAAGPPAAEHDARTKLRLLGALGIGDPDERTHTSLRGKRPSPAVETWLRAQRELGRPLVGLLPGSRKLDRRAPLELFTAIGAAFEQQNSRPVVVYGPGEESLAESLASALGAPMAPPTDLEELACLLRGLDAVVANDTGPMHLAVALGVPTLSLFLHPDRLRWGYVEAPHRALMVPELGEAEVLRQSLLFLDAALRRGGAD